MPKAETFSFADDGTIPNNPDVAVRLYRDVLGGRDVAGGFEALFASNGWSNSWRNGVYDFHHFHSTAHEVLGVARGRVEVRVGGPFGEVVMLKRGDVVVLPAGTGHRNEGSSADLVIVGAYAEGRAWDVCRGEAAQAAQVRTSIRLVPASTTDPATGAKW
jgi:uncharacterized protein YjlB